jgi:toxin ParE1/3/4
MLRVLWLAGAREDLKSIVGYIAKHSISAAEQIKNDILRKTAELPKHPYLYRAGRLPGTRELVAHPNYVVVYRVTSKAIHIVAVFHARTTFPP